MSLNKTLAVTKACDNLFQITKQAQNKGICFTLTKQGKPEAVIMSFKEFNVWQETLEVMKDFPDLNKDIQELKEDCKTGAYKNYKTLEDVIGENNFIVKRYKRSS